MPKPLAAQWVDQWTRTFASF